jgi:hypothetical protein
MGWMVSGFENTPCYLVSPSLTDAFLVRTGRLHNIRVSRVGEQRNDDFLISLWAWNDHPQCNSALTAEESLRGEREEREESKRLLFVVCDRQCHNVDENDG